VKQRGIRIDTRRFTEGWCCWGVWDGGWGWWWGGGVGVCGVLLSSFFDETQLPADHGAQGGISETRFDRRDIRAFHAELATCPDGAPNLASANGRMLAGLGDLGG